jgi:hypothetical protein
MEITGNYNLEVKIGDTILDLNPYMIEELTICQDIDRLVPTFKCRVKDSTQLLGGIIPYDKNSNRMSIAFQRGSSLDRKNKFSFVVKRRKFVSEGTYEVDGVLDIPNLFTPLQRRSLSGNLKSNIEELVLNELEIKNQDVGSSLDYVKTVLQLNWPNSYLLYYLKNVVEGKSGETCYFCFIKNAKGKPTFVFKSLEELLLTEVTHKFIVGQNPFEDYYPVSEFHVFDNSQFRASFNSTAPNYRYFNYETGTYVTTNDLNINSTPSLSKQYLVDSDDTSNMSVSYLGRNNDFTNNFSGRMGQSFYSEVNDSINMWISTWGIEDVYPGSVVKVLFAEALNKGNLFVYQHSGFWMVKKVVHIFGTSYMSNILLTRCGINTDIPTSLSPANRVKK